MVDLASMAAKAEPPTQNVGSALRVRLYAVEQTSGSSSRSGSAVYPNAASNAVAMANDFPGFV
jgi:hypothetical protein